MCARPKSTCCTPDSQYPAKSRRRKHTPRAHAGPHDLCRKSRIRLDVVTLDDLEDRLDAAVVDWLLHEGIHDSDDVGRTDWVADEAEARLGLFPRAAAPGPVPATRGGDDA